MIAYRCSTEAIFNDTEISSTLGDCAQERHWPPFGRGRSHHRVTGTGLGRLCDLMPVGFGVSRSATQITD